MFRQINAEVPELENKIRGVFGKFKKTFLASQSWKDFIESRTITGLYNVVGNDKSSYGNTRSTRDFWDYMNAYFSSFATAYEVPRGETYRFPWHKKGPSRDLALELLGDLQVTVSQCMTEAILMLQIEFFDLITNNYKTNIRLRQKSTEYLLKFFSFMCHETDTKRFISLIWNNMVKECLDVLEVTNWVTRYARAWFTTSSDLTHLNEPLAHGMLYALPLVFELFPYKADGEPMDMSYVTLARAAAEATEGESVGLKFMSLFDKMMRETYHVGYEYDLAEEISKAMTSDDDDDVSKSELSVLSTFPDPLNFLTSIERLCQLEILEPLVAKQVPIGGNGDGQVVATTKDKGKEEAERNPWVAQEALVEVEVEDLRNSIDALTKMNISEQEKINKIISVAGNMSMEQLQMAEEELKNMQDREVKMSEVLERFKKLKELQIQRMKAQTEEIERSFIGLDKKPLDDIINLVTKTKEAYQKALTAFKDFDVENIQYRDETNLQDVERFAVRILSVLKYRSAQGKSLREVALTKRDWGVVFNSISHQVGDYELFLKRIDKIQDMVIAKSEYESAEEALYRRQKLAVTKEGKRINVFEQKWSVVWTTGVIATPLVLGLGIGGYALYQTVFSNRVLQEQAEALLNQVITNVLPKADPGIRSAMTTELLKTLTDKGLLNVAAATAAETQSAATSFFNTVTAGLGLQERPSFLALFTGEWRKILFQVTDAGILGPLYADRAIQLGLSVLRALNVAWHGIGLAYMFLFGIFFARIEIAAGREPANARRHYFGQFGGALVNFLVAFSVLVTTDVLLPKTEHLTTLASAAGTAFSFASSIWSLGGVFNAVKNVPSQVQKLIEREVPKPPTKEMIWKMLPSFYEVFIPASSGKEWGERTYRTLLQDLMENSERNVRFYKKLALENAAKSSLAFREASFEEFRPTAHPEADKALEAPVLLPDVEEMTSGEE